MDLTPENEQKEFALAIARVLAREEMGVETLEEAAARKPNRQREHRRRQRNDLMEADYVN